MTKTQEHKKDSSFTVGMLMGAIFGGSALFFFGTKTGKKIKKRLQEEFKEGNFDFEAIKKDTQKRIEKLITSSNIDKLLSGPNSIPDKPKKTKTKKKIDPKRFFSNVKTSK
jgi:gas vesicle protein